MITLLLSRSPSRREAALARLGVGGRVRRLVEAPLAREWLLQDAAGLTGEVEVLRPWLGDLWHRIGDGRAVLTERAAALRAVPLLAADPTLAAIPDPRQTAQLLLAAESYPLWERVGSDRTLLFRDAIRGLPARLRSAPAALAADWTVIDEPVDADDALANAVVALARACAAAGSRVVIACHAARDRAGREAGEIFGWDEAFDRGMRVLAATAATRRALFSLVESGEAQVVVAGADGLRVIEPWTEPDVDGPRTLSDAFADQRPYEGPYPAGLTVLAAVDPIAEVRAVASALADRLEAGADPRSICVAADLARYAPLVQAAFDDLGLPHDLVPRAAATPLALAIDTLLGQVAEGFSADGLCAIAERAGIPGADVVRRWVRLYGQRVVGPPVDWTAAVQSAERSGAEGMADAVAALDACADRLDPLRGECTPIDLGDRLLAVLEDLGWAGRGPEWGAVLRALDEVLRDALLAGVHTWTAGDLRAELASALAGQPAARPEGAQARIRVVDLDAIGGIGHTHVVLLGLARGSFPTPVSPLAASFEAQAVRRALFRARFRFAERLREAEEPGHTLLLSWPTTVDGRSQAPSPLLSELLGLLSAHRVDGATPDPRSARADRIAAVLRGTPRAPDVPQVDLHRARLGALGPYDGILRRPPTRPAAISVSALETFIACPARYWYAHVLRLPAPGARTPELEPRRRGTVLHAILERFLRSRDLRPLTADPDPATTRRALWTEAEQVLDALDSEGGFDPLFQRYARSRWVAGLIDDRPAGILRAWLDHEQSGPALIPVGVEVEIQGLVWAGMRVRGVVDRVDRLPSGAHLVTDYKTGTPPTRERVARGLSLQPLVYSEAVGRERGTDVASAFISLSRADRVRRTGFVGDAAALELACSPIELRSALVLAADERRRRLESAEAQAGALVAGQFPPTRHAPEVAGCPTCPYRRICRRDPLRHAAEVTP